VADGRWVEGAAKDRNGDGATHRLKNDAATA
jgi:hypothetical protein